MPTDDVGTLFELAATLAEAHRELNLAREQSTRPKHLFVRARRAVVQATRAIVAAIDAGLDEPNVSWLLWSLRKPDDPSRPSGRFEGPHGSYELRSTKLGSGCEPDGTLRDDTAFELWKFCLSPMLRSRHSALKADAGAFDFPKVQTDERGRVLGRDGKPLERLDKIDPKTREPRGWQLNGPAATVIDTYDEQDALEHLRCQAADWADACDAARILLLDAATTKGEAAPNNEGGDSPIRNSNMTTLADRIADLGRDFRALADTKLRLASLAVGDDNALPMFMVGPPIDPPTDPLCLVEPQNNWDQRQQAAVLSLYSLIERGGLLLAEAHNGGWTPTYWPWIEHKRDLVLGGWHTWQVGLES